MPCRLLLWNSSRFLLLVINSQAAEGPEEIAELLTVMVIVGPL